MSFTWKREQREHEVFVPKRVEKTNLRHSWIKGTRPMHAGAQKQVALVCCLACCLPSVPAWQQEVQSRRTPRLQNWGAVTHPLVQIFFCGRVFWPDFGSQEFVLLLIYSILYQGFCFVISPANFICQSSHPIRWDRWFTVPTACYPCNVEGGGVACLPFCCLAFCDWRHYPVFFCFTLKGFDAFLNSLAKVFFFLMGG